jgi:putative DNA primase/helicase
MKNDRHQIHEAKRPPLFTTPEPWPEPQDGEVLLDELRAAIRRFIVTGDEEITALALWIIHTHVHDAFLVSPILGVVSPDKGSGKTTLLSVLTRLVRYPLAASNLSPAVIYRSIERYHPTLLIDEADTFMDGRSDLIGILNSGHTKALATIARSAPDTLEPQFFSTWAPKAIAKIGALPPTLEDRAIALLLRRMLSTEQAEKLRPSHYAGLEEILRRIVRWSADNIEQLREADPAVPDALQNRAADNWRPLLAIADRAGERWAREARRCAEVFASRGVTEVDERVRLLGDIRTVWSTTEGHRITSRELVRQLCGMHDSPWGELRNGKGITPNRLARHLHLFGVKPRDLWFGGSHGHSAKGYESDDFRDAFARYLPPVAES